MVAVLPKAHINAGRCKMSIVALGLFAAAVVFGDAITKAVYLEFLLEQGGLRHLGAGVSLFPVACALAVVVTALLQQFTPLGRSVWGKTLAAVIAVSLFSGAYSVWVSAVSAGLDSRIVRVHQPYDAVKLLRILGDERKGCIMVRGGICVLPFDSNRVERIRRLLTVQGVRLD